MKNERRILFAGDSITDSGRERPVARRFFLGDGYVSLINSYLEMKYYPEGYRVLNYGVSGDTVKDLEKRWAGDVLANAPEYLTVMIGVNDAWRQIDLPFEFNSHVSVDEYYETLTNLILRSKENGSKIILMTPFLIETNEDDKLKTLLRKYTDQVKKISKELDTGFVDVQEAFDSYLQSSGSYSMFLSSDRVHPGLTGHMIIARAWIDYFESRCIKGL